MKVRRIVVIITALAALCFWAGSALAQEGSQEQPAAGSQVPPRKGLKDMEGTICPVMGGAINTKYSQVHEGTVYYFCCPECIEKFKADPEKYIEKMSGK